MNFNFKTFTICFVACVVIVDVCHAKSLVPQKLQTTQTSGVSPTKRAYTCSCNDNSEPICANNGVTYKNMCRFECAAHRLDNLRIVKEGDCGKYISKLQFYSFGK